MTAKMSKKIGKTFSFQINGDGWLEGWNTVSSFFSETITREQLGNDRRHYVFPHPNDGWVLNDYYYWSANGVDFVDWSAQSGELFLSPDMYDKYPDHTIFIYTLQPANTSEHSITVKAARWNGTGWNQDTQGSKVGFDKNNMSTWEITTKAVWGEKITIYASGSSGFQPYPNDTDGWYFNPKGFYDTNHNAYKESNDTTTPKASYSFTVTNNMTIYVDFQYISQ